MINLFKELEKIADIYDNEGFDRHDKPKDMDSAFFRETPTEVLLGEVKTLKIIESMGIINNDKTILLAGSGDGRRAAYLNKAGYDVYAIELNSHLHNKAEYIISKLENKNLIDSSKLKLIQGSFLDDKLYESNNLNFNNFSKVFTYLLPGNNNALINKIEEESKVGTNLFLLTNPDLKDVNTNLKLLKQVNFSVLNAIFCPQYDLNIYKK